MPTEDELRRARAAHSVRELQAGQRLLERWRDEQREPCLVVSLVETSGRWTCRLYLGNLRREVEVDPTATSLLEAWRFLQYRLDEALGELRRRSETSPQANLSTLTGPFHVRPTAPPDPNRNLSVDAQVPENAWLSPNANGDVFTVDSLSKFRAPAEDDARRSVWEILEEID